MNRSLENGLGVKLLRSFCPPHLLEEIEGDLLQRFERDVKIIGERKAKRRLMWNVIRFLRPGILLRNKFSKRLNSAIMLRNYFTVAWRSFLKRKALGFINIIGISFGISFTLLAVLFVQDEFSFDDFHQNIASIYRVDHFAILGDSPDLTTRAYGFPIPFGPALKESISGITTRYDDRINFIKVGQKQFREKIHFVDADFVKMFTLDFIDGNRELALKDVNDILISDEKALKLFGKTDVTGSVLEIDQISYTVSGVFKKLPRNSSFDFEILTRYENFPPYQKQRDDWGAWYGSVFVMLNPSGELTTLNKNLQDFSKKHFSQKNSEHQQVGIVLTPLSKLHFDIQTSWFNVSNIKYSYILGGIALVVLLVACANYVLLSLAGSMTRTREIGIRKVIGATRKMVRAQFLGESLIVIGVSLPVAVLILQLALPEFNDFMGREINLLRSSGSIWVLSILAIVLVTGLLAGGYPAMVLSGLMPEKILKSNANGNYKNRFSGFLIVFQFTICFVLLICAIIMFNQMKMVQTRDLGFNKDQVVIVDVSNDLNISGKRILSRFRNEFANDQDVLSVFGLKSDFGKIPMSMSFKDSTGKDVSIHFTSVEYDFFEMLNISLIEGRYFSRKFPADTMNRFVLNETYAKQLGTESYIGKSLPLAPGSEVVGVVKDFNFESLEHQVKPIAFFMGRGIDKVFVKISPGNIPATIEKLEKCWKKTVAEGPFQFTFLDDHINKQYQRYTQWIRIISISAFLAISIACLGLLGIINLAVINRTKEIGIRKVLGATISSIFLLFSKHYVRLIFMGFALASPMAYYLSTQWLQSFAYKVDVGWITYTIPLIFILGLAFAILAAQIIKKARINPVESIRYE